MVCRRGLVSVDRAEIAADVGVDGAVIAGELSRETAEAVAGAVRRETGASHALAVLIEVDDGPDRIDFGGSIHLATAAEAGVETRRPRIYGGAAPVGPGGRRAAPPSTRPALPA